MPLSSIAPADQLGGTLEVSSSRRGTAITARVFLSAAEIELQLEG